MIAVLLVHPGERAGAVSAMRNGSMVHLCASVAELARAVADTGVRGIVSDIEDSSGAECFAVLKMLEARPVPPSVLIVVNARSRSARHVHRFASLDLDVRVVVRGSEDMTTAVHGLVALALPSNAHSPILRAAALVLTPTAMTMATICLLHSFPKASVSVVARSCLVSTRTLERTLAIDGSLPARSLMGWALALNAVWRLEKLGWSIKQTALGAGFPTRDAFANCVRRQTGLPPKLLAQDVGFDALLRQFSFALDRAHHARASSSGVGGCCVEMDGGTT